MSNSIQSINYRPKLSDGTGGAGWKLNGETGELEINGVVRVKLSGSASDDKPEPKTFIVVDGVTYISEAFVDDASIKNAKIANDQLASMWSIKVELGPGGKRYAGGIGVGINSQFVVDTDRFAIHGRDASEILRYLSSKIGEAKLGQDLKEQIDLSGSSLADQVKDVIRSELRQGGLLWRSR